MEVMYMQVKEVMQALGVSQAKAYTIIKELNTELKAKGYITLNGRISKKYFAEKFYGARYSDGED